MTLFRLLRVMGAIAFRCRSPALRGLSHSKIYHKFMAAVFADAFLISPPPHRTFEVFCLENFSGIRLCTALNQTRRNSTPSKASCRHEARLHVLESQDMCSSFFMLVSARGRKACLQLFSPNISTECTIAMGSASSVSTSQMYSPLSSTPMSRIWRSVSCSERRLSRLTWGEG